MGNIISLTALLEGVAVLGKNIDRELNVKGIKTHSKSIEDGEVYIALKGGKLNGEDFIDEAFNNGAVAVVTETECDYPHVKVRDTREALALIAGNFYGNAHRFLSLIGVTGTNGKTTTTYILNKILSENGRKTAVIGTLGIKLNREKVYSTLTTPDPIELHETFYNAVQRGVDTVIMEVSAHAIHYKKLDGLKFDYLIFTNLSQDHLDFFGNMQDYEKTKLGFFTPNKVKVAVVNVDDDAGKRLVRKTDVLTLTYGIRNPSDVFSTNIREKQETMRFVLNAFDDIAEISLPLLGEYNVYNAMAAATCARAMKIPMENIALALEKVEEIDGRFNIIKCDITVIIDYAHTPDGLANILKAVRKLEGNKVITVFGCGGDRDKGKRPLMGKVASAYSDFCVLTSDNPRTEDPVQIIKDIEQGMLCKREEYTCISDRKNAISFAISRAKPGDKVLIAGKGGEDYIEIMRKKYPFSDKEVAQMAIRRYRE